ncbi:MULTISPECIES: DUF2188 domain-containing protein [unclassified Rathayibacter]|uniref:DUF2188 domain-containing protein n=1 Tax=unclassified Rathayibacter TaxID=2609250 RepID=UPI00188CC41C|nr:MULTISPECIES: DUF2188 domain-containing protein [unclassified Rathayibacter]MBF4461190.1 DUF2188 domain-containing protein [Rathayibacter sp. VKM Ac-2879]MBF4502601.1 DUF2188 domain-containing protein [Rathayibacter sp. VKM Ac-2878]
MSATTVLPIETYADEHGWHNRIAQAEVPLSHHDSREEAEEAGIEIAEQRGGEHIVLC